MKKTIFNLTHYDLDGVAAAIVVKHFTNSACEYRQEWCGYASMDKKLRKFVAKCSEPVILVVTDLALDIETIRDMCEDEYVEQFIYIDHHERQSDELEELERIDKEFKKFKMEIDYSRSAAMIAYDMFVKQWPGDADDKIYQMAKLADIYDRWLTKSKAWDIAHDLNDAFWELHFDRFFDMYDAGYPGVDNIKDIVIGVQAQRKEYMADTKKRYSIDTVINNKKTLIVLNPKSRFYNDFSLEFPDHDLWIIWREMKKGENIFSVRSNQKTMKDFNLNDIFEKVKIEDTRLQGGGHQHSGGISVGIADPQEAVETLTEVFERELK
jgi:oligoribonuclease NrnB/cAMP/cGMP phosphodiesterase (DHH superfamily)